MRVVKHLPVMRTMIDDIVVVELGNLDGFRLRILTSGKKMRDG